MRQSGVTYRHFTDEEIKKANSVDLLMLAKQYGYETEKGGKNAIHLKKSGGLYIFIITLLMKGIKKAEQSVL